MARVTRPLKEHPHRTTIETAGGAVLVTVGLYLLATSGHETVLLISGLALFVVGVYAFAQYYWTWLPSLPAPRERLPRVKPSAAHDIAKELLKEDGLWPRWWQLRRRLGGGLTLQQYEALKAREIAAERRKQAAAGAKPTPPPPMSTEAFVKKVAEIGETVKKGDHQTELGQLISRGSQLRSAATSQPTVDTYTRRFQPGTALAEALAAAVPTPPADVNHWLESVGRFVGQNFAHHYGALHQTGLKRRDSQEIVAAIDRNLAVLRLIEKELQA